MKESSLGTVGNSLAGILGGGLGSQLLGLLGLAQASGGGMDIKSIISSIAGGGVAGGIDYAMNLINNPATGGLGGLVEAFKSKGLGEVMSSWISTGENKSISPDQIKQALGSDKIQQIAEKAGISKDAVSQQLSKLLPQIIDKLTPDGKLPEAGKVGEALNMLKNKFLSS